MKLTEEKIKEIFIENSTCSKISRYRKFIENFNGNKCNKCGIENWCGDNITLEIDHINGINTDNRVENLRLLCPNCHSQTETFRGRNIKKKKNKDGLYRYSIEEFIKAVNISKTIREVCIRLNITPKGGNYATVSNKIKELNLSLIQNEINFGNLDSVYNEKKKNTCICGKTINRNSKSCEKCYHLRIKKVKDRPILTDLLEDIKNFGYKKTGEKYGVSDNCIRKWLKKAE
jgi:hypothetical protein